MLTKNKFMLPLVGMLFSTLISSVSFGDLITDYESANKPGILNWLADGRSNNKPSYYCSHFYLKTLYKSGLSVRDQAQAVQTWVETCRRHFEQNYRAGDLTVLFDFTMLQTRITHNKLIRPVEIKTADGRILNGTLGFINDGKKRPLVIGRCGVYCSGMSGSAVTSFVGHLFEESHFNVLFLQSMTNKDYSAANKTISVSGFDEAGQMFEMAQDLDNVAEGLHRSTSEVHFMGYSLGAHAALFTSLIASLNTSRVPIRSVVALCPVVDLQTQMEYLFKEDSIRGKIVAFVNRTLLKTMNRLFPIFTDEELINVAHDSEGLKKIISVNNLRFYQRNAANLSFAKYNPYRGVKIETFDDIWKLSRWQDYASQVRIPTFVAGSRDDSVVSFKLNTGIIPTEGNDSLGVVKFEGGNHCGFDLYGGWGLSSVMLNSFMDSHSDNVYPTLTVPLDNVKWDDTALSLMKEDSVIQSYDWETVPKDDIAILNVYVPKDGASKCSRSWERPCNTDNMDVYRYNFPLVLMKQA
ncbi:MAG: hypothetical protein V4736_03380, partial [Bdellovibrionota bacterium]